MGIPKMDDVKLLLLNREPVIARLMHGAWDRWLQNPEMAQLFRRTRACLVHNYAMLAAPAAFATDAGIAIIPLQETSLFCVENRLLFRIKKGDEQGLSSNIDTQASLAFTDPQQCIPGVPDLERVDISYVLNPLETLIAKILVVARDGGDIAWRYEIYPVVVPVAVPPVPFIPSSQPSADSVVRLPDSGETEKKKQG